jgi:hypothetical protein
VKKPRSARERRENEKLCEEEREIKNKNERTRAEWSIYTPVSV